MLSESNMENTGAAAQERNCPAMKKAAEIMAHFLPGVGALEMLIVARGLRFSAKLQEGNTCSQR